MEAFKTHQGFAVPLDRANVDTDAIIPKQFLKSIARTGFGESLFFDWRYLENGKSNPEFILNRPDYKNATILVTKNNFGCGSSREHAVWAIQQYGFHVVIAPSKGEGDSRIPAFADIFRNNSLKNSLLTIELSESEVEEIFAAIQKNPSTKLTVDLDQQTIVLDSRTYRFQIDSAIKHRMLNGLDDIGITLQEDASIHAFEQKHNSQLYR